MSDHPDEDMRYTDIAEEILEKGLRTSTGKNPANAVYTTLSTKLVPMKVAEKVAKSTFRLTDSSTARVAAPDIADPSAEEQDRTARENREDAGIIQSFGMHWLRDAVLWKSSKTQLLGAVTKRNITAADTIDFSGQQGVYILYNGARPVYAGQAGKERMGARLQEHTVDRLATRWDRFSWFGLCPYLEASDSLGEPDPALFTGEKIISALEGLLIEGMEVALNRRGGDFLRGKEYTQVTHPDLEKETAVIDDVRKVVRDVLAQD